MHVGIYLGVETSWNRLIIRGITRFLNQHEGAILTPLPLMIPPQHLMQAGIEGLIIMRPSHQHRLFSNRTIPMVSLSRHNHSPRCLELWSGYKEMTQQALTHLKERGCNRVAILSTSDPALIYNHHKEAEVKQGLEAFGMQSLGSFTERQRKPWNLSKQLHNICGWLKQLPKPMGLVCTDATHALRALHCLRQLGLQVPGDVFLLCLSNDSILLECTSPGISSVNFDHETKGYKAAKLLARAIEHHDVTPCREYIPTKGIIPRGSTAFAAPQDPPLQKAMMAMKDWEYSMPSLDDIARISGMSRSTLSRKLKDQTGLTPGELSVQFRLEKALEQLRVGTESLAVIADLCGYGLPSQLSREVKSKTGMTPSHYRTYWQSQ